MLIAEKARSFQSQVFLAKGNQQVEGTEVVLIAHGPAAEADYWRIREALIRVLSKAGLYRDDSSGGDPSAPD